MCVVADAGLLGVLALPRHKTASVPVLAYAVIKISSVQEEYLSML